ncbi:MAG: 3'-5' exonuclease, partial [Bacillota bacterium]|nr:3'-5' exonuclease [Bacillota bacterium]
SSDRFALMLKECFFDSSYEIQENLTHKKNILEFIKKCPVEQLMYPSEDFTIPKEITDCAIWRKASYGFEKARQFLDFPISMMEKLILFAAQELQFGREDMAIACKIAGDVRYLTGPQYGWSMEDLANELLKPKSIFTFFAGTMWELKGYEPRPGIVTLSTYHKAKGLEWDTVFLTGLTYDDFPVNLEDRFKGESWYLKQEFRNPGALVKTELQMLLENKESGDAITESKIENISERARLLYVGITRAKRYLFLSGHHANPNRKNEIQPSRYLIELKKYIDSMEITRNTVK